MLRPVATALTVAALLAAAGPVLAQPLPTNNPAAMQNVRESRQYEALVRSNPAFRNKRMQEECGPITDPQLHAQCVASFSGPPGSAPRSGHLPRSE